jgi:hypothetical protein
MDELDTMRQSLAISGREAPVGAAMHGDATGVISGAITPSVIDFPPFPVPRNLATWMHARLTALRKTRSLVRLLSVK